MTKDKIKLAHKDILGFIELNLIMKDTNQTAFRCRICKKYYSHAEMDNVCMCCGSGVCKKCIGIR